MLQFTGLAGLGDVAQDFVDCLAEAGHDLDTCAALHPQGAALIEPPTPTEGVVLFDSSVVSKDRACSVCNPNTQWCDNGACINFTAAEMAQWAVAGKPPGAIVTRPAPAKAFMGIPVKTIAIIGAVGVGLLLFLRSRSTKRA